MSGPGRAVTIRTALPRTTATRITRGDATSSNGTGNGTCTALVDRWSGNDARGPAAYESDLVLQLANGDHGAMAEVYRRHAGPVAGAVGRVLFDRARCEDVVQDVFLTLWRRPERFDPDRGSLRGFLMAIARSRAIDVRRSDHAREQREARRSREAHSHPGSALEVEGAVLREAVSEEVRAALQALPHRMRAPIELAFYGARSYTQVAADLGLPEGTVKSQIRSGLRQLAATLGDTPPR